MRCANCAYTPYATCIEEGENLEYVQRPHSCGAIDDDCNFPEWWVNVVDGSIYCMCDKWIKFEQGDPMATTIQWYDIGIKPHRDGDVIIRNSKTKTNFTGYAYAASGKIAGKNGVFAKEADYWTYIDNVPAPADEESWQTDSEGRKFKELKSARIYKDSSVQVVTPAGMKLRSTVWKDFNGVVYHVFKEIV